MSGELNSFELNSAEINGSGSVTLPDVSFLTIKQEVGVYSTTNNFLTIKQEVNYLSSSTSNNFLTIKQQVASFSNSNNFLTIKQKVRSPTLLGDYYGQNGWDVEVVIDNLLITTQNEERNYGLCGRMTVSVSEGQARSCVFTIIPPEDTIDFSFYEGKDVVCYITNRSNNIYNVFTGFVDSISVDFIGRKLTISCSDHRSDKLLSLDYSVISSIGSYSYSVFGIPKDNYEEFTGRLQTTPASFDFDGYGVGYLTAWKPKSIPDFTLNSSTVYYKNPELSYVSTDKNYNIISIQVNYSYQRLHQQVVHYNWAGYGDDWLSNWFLVGKPSLPLKTLIEGVVYSSQNNWNVVRAPQYVELWPAQGFFYNGQALSWEPNKVVNTYKERTEFMGYAKNPDTGSFVTVGTPPKLVPIYLPVLDSKGNVVMEKATSTTIETSQLSCRGVSWRSGRRFSQTVVEQYYVNLTATQSISQYGAIADYQVINIDNPYDTTDWETSGGVKSIAMDTNFYKDISYKQHDLVSAILVSLDRAKTKILQAHRDVQTNFRLKYITPEIDLKHTLELDISDPVASSSGDNHMTVKGKVYALTHTIDFDGEDSSTEITIRGSRSQGSASNDTWAITPVPIQPSYIGSVKTIELGTHLGLDPATTLGGNKWNGYIGNKTDTNVVGLDTVTLRSQLVEQFIVDFPAIPEYLRQEMTYSSQDTFNISIPNDIKDVGF